MFKCSYGHHNDHFGLLSQVVDIRLANLSAWKLKLSVTKTTSTAFHLNNKETKRQLAVNVRGNTLPYNPNPTYLGVKLDRQLTYKQHVEDLCQEILARNNTLCCLAGSSWGASTPTISSCIRLSGSGICRPQFGVVAVTSKNLMLR